MRAPQTFMFTPSGAASATGTYTTEVVTPIVRGSSASGGTLTLKSTSHATLGKVLFGAAGTSAYDEVNNRLGIGTASPTTPFHVLASVAAPGANSTLATFALTATAADAFGRAALSANTTSTNTSGIIAQTIGIDGRASGTGSGGTTSVGMAQYARVDCATGHTITIARNYFADDGIGSGTWTTLYGLFVNTLTKGATNWAVYTLGATPSRFEGVVQVGGLKSSDGSTGVPSGTFTGGLGETITVKNGIITNIA